MDATARAMIICAGQESVNDITTSGAFNANAKDSTLAIEAQRDAWDVIAAAVQLGDIEMASSGLHAIEWGFSPEIAGSDKSWPTDRDGDKSGQNSLHPKASSSTLQLAQSDSSKAPALRRFRRANRRASSTRRPNTRTTTCGDPVPGPGPKGTNIDIIPLRLRYTAKLLGKSATIDPIADNIETFGQGFDHINSCSGF